MRIVLVHSAQADYLRALEHYLSDALRKAKAEVLDFDLRSELDYHRLGRKRFAEELGIGLPAAEISLKAGESLLHRAVAFGANAILTVSPRGLHPETLADLRRLGIRSAFWSLWPTESPHPETFDYVWYAYPRESGDEELLLPPALPLYHPIQETDPAFKKDLVYFGPATRDATALLERYSETLSGYAFKVLGEGWAEIANAGRTVPSLNPQRLLPATENRYLAGASLALTGGDFWSFLNAAAAGTFQLNLTSDLIREHFSPMDGYQPLTDVAGLPEAIADLLERAEEGRRQAARLKTKVLSEHSLENRARQILARLPENPTLVPGWQQDPPGGVLSALESAWSNPNEGPTISLCMMTKNEEALLPGCLASVRGAVDQIIVVDTGSTDKTVEIARSFGAEVVTVPWQDDFSAPRNAGLERATGDWILILDADERLDPEDRAKLLALVRSEFEGFFLNIVNYGDLQGSRILDSGTIFRLFRNRPEYRFKGRVHEQIFSLVKESGRPIGYSEIRLHHFGYASEVLAEKEKRQRNLRILESEEADNPFVLFNLGREYQRVGKLPEAIREYKKALAEPEITRLFYYTALIEGYVTSLIQMDMPEEALEAVEEGLQARPQLPDLYYLKGVALLRIGKPREAFESFLWALAQPEDLPEHHYRSHGIQGKAWLNIARLHRLSGNVAQTIGSYQKALESSGTRSEALVELGDYLLETSDPREAQAFMETLLDPSDPGNLRDLQSIFHRNGYHDLAAEYAERLAVRGADSRDPLQRLRALLYLGRYGEAIAESLPALLEGPALAMETRYLRFLTWLGLARPDLAEAELRLLPESPEREASLAAADILQNRPLPAQAPEPAATVGLINRLLTYRLSDVARQLPPLLAKLLPNLGESARVFGTLFIRNGFYPEGIEYLRVAIDAGRADAETYRLLEHLARRKGFAEEAKIFHQKAGELEVAAYGVSTV